MKLYTNALAPSPRKVEIFLAEKGIRLPMEEIDIIRGENRAAAFLAINPLGHLPVLVLADGEAITESAAICRYLEERHPSPPALFGGDPRARLRVDMWTRRLEWYLLRHIYDAYWFGHPSSGRQDKNPAAAECALRQARGYLPLLEEALAKRAFVAGDCWSFADITLLAGLDFARVVGLRPGEDTPALSAWLTAARARPAAKRRR